MREKLVGFTKKPRTISVSSDSKEVEVKIKIRQRRQGQEIGGRERERERKREILFVKISTMEEVVLKTTLNKPCFILK